MSDRREFSFCVLTYNQQDTIIETLESIEYQITKYGEDGVFNLYITDDASKDATGERIHEWLQENRRLFEKVEVLTNTVNRGTVYNYNCLMRLVGGEPFKVIAGDDLIGPYNIFSRIGSEESVMYTFPYLRLENGRITYRKRYLYDYYFRLCKYKRSRNCRWMRLGDFIHTPSTFYMKSLYQKSNSTDFNKQFFLFEDDPTFYSFFKNSPEVSVSFGTVPLILYRYTQGSTSTVPNNAFLKDWKKLQELYIRDTTGVEKKYLQIRLWSYFHNRLIYQGMERLRQLWRIAAVEVADHKGFAEFEKRIQNSVDECSMYYADIQKISSKYRRHN